MFHVVLWRSFLMRARQEGTVPLSQGYFPELCRNCKCLSTPTGCQAREGQKRQWGNQLQLIQPNLSKGNKQLWKRSFSRKKKKKEKKSLRGKQWSLSLSLSLFLSLSLSLAVAAAMWWFKRPFVRSQIPAPTPSAQCPNTTLSGTDIKFSGRNSTLIGLFTSVCNERDPL